MWNNGTRHSLLELCILGPVSSNALVGFDIPDRFWRYLNHGKDHRVCLENSLSFLADCGTNILEQPCQRARNGLFFAIMEGNRDATQCLLSSPSSKLDTLFAKSEGRKEIRSQILGIDEKLLRKHRKHQRKLDTYEKSSLSFLTIVTSKPSSRGRGRCRKGTRFRRRRSSPWTSNSGDSDSIETSDEEEGSTTSDSDSIVTRLGEPPFIRVNGQADNPQASITRSSFSAGMPVNLDSNLDREGRNSFPVDHRDIQGLVDAIY